MTFDLNSFITLFLIGKFENFRNAYSLTRVLAWKFQIINIVEITELLDSHGLILKINEQGISFYTLTTEGKQYVFNYLEKGKLLMLETYPEEKAFVTSLFK